MSHFRIIITDYESHMEAIKDVRRRVFIVEQAIDPDLEVDGMDGECIHCLIEIDGEPIATGRMLPDGHIGRLAVIKSHRGKGHGMKVLMTLIDRARQVGLSSVYLHSQYHARDFYTKAGFVEKGRIFQEAGIDHIMMEKLL